MMRSYIMWLFCLLILQSCANNQQPTPVLMSELLTPIAPTFTATLTSTQVPDVKPATKTPAVISSATVTSSPVPYISPTPTITPIPIQSFVFTPTPFEHPPQGHRRTDSIFFLSPDRGWLLGQLGSEHDLAVYTTQNNGDSWQRLALIDTLAYSNPASYKYEYERINQIYFANEYDGWLYGAGALVTHDGGSTWQPEAQKINQMVTLRNNIWAIEQLTNTTRIIYSDDAYTWQPLSVQPEITPERLAISESAIWVQGVREVYQEEVKFAVSFDQGQAWHYKTFAAPYTTQIVFDVSEHNGWLFEGYGASGGWQTKAFRISRNFGDTWQLQSNAHVDPSRDIGDLPMWGYLGNNRDLAVINDTTAFVWFGRGSLLQTTNGGITWNYTGSFWQSSGDASPDLVYFYDDMHGWLPFGNHLYRTTDGGETWIEFELY